MGSFLAKNKGQKQGSVVLCVDDAWCRDTDCAWCRDMDCAWCLLAVLPSPEPADGGAAVGTGG